MQFPLNISLFLQKSPLMISLLLFSFLQIVLQKLFDILYFSMHEGFITERHEHFLGDCTLLLDLLKDASKKVKHLFR